MNFLYAIVMSAGIMNGGITQYDVPRSLAFEDPIYTNISADIQYGPFFGIAEIRTDMSMVNLASFWPWQNTYTLGGGVRYGALEVGIIHTCYHPMVPYQKYNRQIVPSYEGGINDFYISLRFSNY